MTTPGAAAEAIRDAVMGWLATLEPGQRARATFPFDTDERFVWAYTPGRREGLPLGEMTAAQRDAALAVIDASLSAHGASDVRSIMALEPILGELERLAGDDDWAGRDPGLYWLAVFGDPAGTAPWSWRIGGHHVALQLTLAGGGVVASAPCFLGANPAVVPSGPFAGQRTLADEEALARSLLAVLSASQRGVAIVDAVAPPDIRSGHGRRAILDGIPLGIAHGDLDATQRTGLERLIRHYLGRVRPEVAEPEWDRIHAAGLAPVMFAWAGPDAPGLGHYYAVRGATFLIEYDNTQNGANHIHAVWRDLTNDWGDDVLAAHYRLRHPG